MTVASTIVVAREDLSIPGLQEEQTDQADHSKDGGQRFFDLLRNSRPDVVVLNLTVTEGRGVQTIQKVRERSGVPILVVCASGDPLTSDYRTAGAAECLHPPIDITVLNRSIQSVISPAHPEVAVRPHDSEGHQFHGITYRPDQQNLTGSEGVLVSLTTAENDVLRYLVSRSWTVCSRAEIAEFVYGEQSPARQQAVGAIVNQLRKKLELAGGAGAAQLVKTEPRRGYTLVVDVVRFSQDLVNGAVR